MFTAPDAYYRTTGRDAVDGAPGVLDRLHGLRQATLDAAGDNGTRFVLAPRLDAHLDDASDGIDRHVDAQRDALTRQIISERQRLIQNAAQLEHNNDDKVAGLAEAHARSLTASPRERRSTTYSCFIKYSESLDDLASGCFDGNLQTCALRPGR